jgi:4-hydroxy-3-methylbut-2-en-1-yl diphosphate synthase IspG/GcpE
MKKSPKELTPREREIMELKEKIRRDEHEVINCPKCNRQMVQKSTPMVTTTFHMWQYDCKKHTTLSGKRYENPAPEKWYKLD